MKFDAMRRNVMQSVTLHDGTPPILTIKVGEI